MKIKILSILAIMALLLSACGGDSPAPAGAQDMLLLSLDAVDSAVSTSGLTSKANTKIKSRESVSWTSSDGSISITGTVETDGTTDTYALSITFNSHTHIDGTETIVMNGTVTYSGSETESSATLNYNGDLDVSYNAEAHDLLWDINLTVTLINDDTGVRISLKGSYTVDDWSGNYNQTIEYTP